MLIGSREAERQLASGPDGAAGLSRNQARRLLRTGIAGQAQHVGRALAYDEEAVRRLRPAPEVERATLERLRPLVVRLGPARSLDLNMPWEEQARVVGERWAIPFEARLQIRREADHRKAHVIATVGHRAVFCADLEAWRSGPASVTARWGTTTEQLADMVLQRAGAWADEVLGRRITLGPGHPWCVWSHHQGFKPPEPDPCSIDAIRAARLSAAAARADRPPDPR